MMDDIEKSCIRICEVSPKAHEVLVELLDHKSARIRLDAASALLTLGLGYMKLYSERSLRREGEEWRGE
jgi:HEAT repeat protein